MADVLAEFFGFLQAVFTAAGKSWRLDPNALTWVETQPYPVLVVLAVAMIAGFSTLLGNSVVLFLNQVRGFRFWFSIFLNGLSLSLLYLTQAVVIYVVGVLIGDGPAFVHVLLAVMLSTAPMFFGVVVLVPFAGVLFARVLQVWSFLALWAVITVGYGRGMWFGLVVAGIGWAVMQLLSWAFAKPVTWVGDKIWRLVTGKPSMLTGHDILAGHPFMPVGVDSLPPRQAEAG